MLVLESWTLLLVEEAFKITTSHHFPHSNHGLKRFGLYLYLGLFLAL